jgi:hypothetical protein
MRRSTSVVVACPFFMVWMMLMVACWCWQTEVVAGFLVHSPLTQRRQPNTVGPPSRRKLSFWLENKHPTTTTSTRTTTPSSSSCSRKKSSLVLLSEPPDQQQNTPNNDEDDDDDEKGQDTKNTKETKKRIIVVPKAVLQILSVVNLLWSFAITFLGVALSCGLLLNLCGYGYIVSKEEGIHLRIDTLDQLRIERQFEKVAKQYERQYKDNSQPPSSLPR